LATLTLVTRRVRAALPGLVVFLVMCALAFICARLVCFAAKLFETSRTKVANGLLLSGFSPADSD
jgi:cytochrome c oxidase assembly factor CtaG